MELLRGETGTIILMDAEDGGLIAAASSPTYDPSAPDRKEIDGSPAGFLNLAIRGRYAPGSTMKIVGAAAILAAGVDPGRQVTCHGSYTLPGWDRPFHCAVRTGHGPENLIDSIKHSCNVFFFEFGNELGPRPLLEMGRAFGFDEKTGIDLPNEKQGQLSSTTDPGRGENTNLWIGQGTMLATPMQVARAYAGLATGYLPTPHVVRATGLADEQARPLEHPRRAPPGPRRPSRPHHEGLWKVVNETGGTAYKASIPREWDVVGKTGTAENPQGKDDAWFAGFFPRSAPKYVFVIPH
jgi:penicillin-binding protein 2